MPESTRQLMDKCYRVFAAYDEIRSYLPPSIKAHFLLSRRALEELDRTTCSIQRDCTTTIDRYMCGLPVKVDMRPDAKDVLLIMEG